MAHRRPDATGSEDPVSSRTATANEKVCMFGRDGVRRLDSAWLSLGIAVSFLALLSTMLARTPQNGDGAEVVAAALHGGVLHPPGFPLMAWLSRLAVAAPIGSPVERIAFLNAAAHAATLFVLLETLRRLQVRFLARLSGALAYVTFPSVWYLGTHTEVFTLAYLLMAVLAYCSVTIERQLDTGPPQRGWVILLGVVAGLGLAQHPIFVTALSALLLTLNRVRSAVGRIQSPLVWQPLALASLIVIAGYCSLLALHHPGCWPDWGQLTSLRDVIRHATRAEYGWSSSPW